jgi:hypothetical protein
MATLPTLRTPLHRIDLGVELGLDAPNGEVGAIHDLDCILRSRGALCHPQDLGESSTTKHRLFRIEIESRTPDRGQRHAGITWHC